MSATPLTSTPFTSTPSATAYGKDFFDYLDESSLRSARGVVPHAVELLRPASIVDVGCGRGAWLRVFQEAGVPEIRGLDGDYVDRENLLIPREHFTPMDLGRRFHVGGKYDLAVSLEVAEHLPEGNAEHLVAELTASAPVVMFSAAIPGQGGVHHVNEQMPDFWTALFQARGYTSVDAIRPLIRDDRTVEFWYRQNLLIYASADALAANPRLEAARARYGAGELEWVHTSIAYRFGSVRALAKELLKATGAAINRRLGGGEGRGR